ncbi:heme exporter protein CcmB [Mesobacillus sp. AQ2]|jgi:heme exporter protein B|uniref:heme exporter protein CcmB n=1 Tax=Bacillaceae TaxID=186817 RepID=UPI00204247A9|nr:MULTISPECIES: heme exporter protein CcmB [Bacillaceae]MCM3125602.1 heme exporter protein CcmB [Mesobacillus sp. MER 33]MCM3235608.1 heme exporter protein CcmB [Mesobacillus sp. MER 48]WHX39691.1 heme exporter protein CcmB [Mesobacillus sp. AQ2]
MMSILLDAWTIASKDLRNEIKTKQTIGMMVIFSSLVVLIFSFAFDPTNNMVKAVIPGLVWLITVFSGILGLNRSFLSEHENDALTGLRSAPIDPSSIYLGKALANFILVTAVQLVSIPVLFLLFDYRFFGKIGWFILVVVIGTLGFIIVGTFLAALSANAKNSEMLLPVLLLPLLSPLLIAGVQATRIVLENEVIADAASWIRLMGAYDLLFLAACFFLFEFIMEGS